jgi:two-component system, response regulator PdtaR
MVILIVEDDILVGVALRLILRIEGYRVRGPTGDVATALKLAAEEEPDLAFVDTRLDGGAEGIDLARALRDRHGTSCIFLTAQPTMARTAGDAALGVIEKPYDPAVVLRTVEYVAAVRGGTRLASVPRGLALLH